MKLKKKHEILIWCGKERGNFSLEKTQLQTATTIIWFVVNTELACVYIKEKISLMVNNFIIILK